MANKIHLQQAQTDSGFERKINPIIRELDNFHSGLAAAFSRLDAVIKLLRKDSADELRGWRKLIGRKEVQRLLTTKLTP
jgi:hypothetical protein